MRKIGTSVFVLVLCLHSYAQDLFFPPELQWWIDEVQKANPTIVIDRFSVDSTREYKYLKGTMNSSGLYPIFYRWNYSGDKLGYFNYGASVSKVKNGKYDIGFDIDSGVLIIDKANSQYILDSFGSSKGIDGIAWLRDNTMVGVGKWIRSINQEKAMVDLIIDVYQVESEKVVITEYVFRDAFNNDVRFGLKLNWYEQRPDYFK